MSQKCTCGFLHTEVTEEGHGGLMALKEDYTTYKSQEEGACHLLGLMLGSTRFGQETEEQGKNDPWAFIVFSGRNAKRRGS